MAGMNRPLIIYFLILFVLCAGFVIGARMMGQQGVYLASGYMLTPAIAAIVTRIFFYKLHFQDAHLRFGRLWDYIKFWLFSLGIMALSFAVFALIGAIRWDLSGKVFLDLLDKQFTATGQDIMKTVPAGFTPQMMLWLFAIGGLTVFNIVPGIISGFGEEFGHRGFMFSHLYPHKPWLGLLLGGVIWYLWHQPLLLVIPAAAPAPLWQMITNTIVAIIGAICTHTYFCYIYAKSKTIFVPSVAHIALNNAARSFAYFVVVQDQFTGNIAQNLIFILIFLLLYYTKELNVVFEFHKEGKSLAATEPQTGVMIPSS